MVVSAPTCGCLGLIEHRHRHNVIIEFVALLVSMRTYWGVGCLDFLSPTVTVLPGLLFDLFTLHQHKWAVFNALIDVSLLFLVVVVVVVVVMFLSMSMRFCSSGTIPCRRTSIRRLESLWSLGSAL